MRTANIWAAPAKAILTAALSAALIVSGSGFTTVPDPAPEAAPFTPTTPDMGTPVPVERWTEPKPATVVPGGVEATAPAPAADTVLGDVPTAATVGQKTARVPMADSVPTSSNGTSNFTGLPGVGAGTWGTTGQTGGFTWNYPFPIRDAPAGKTPALGLSYDSTILDGLTSSTNTQASVVGDGWNLAGSGTIRQKFGSCKDQLPAGTPTWDLCGNPGGQQFSISFGSRSGLIVEDPNQTNPKLKYRLQNDDGSRLEYLTGAGNGTFKGDYWKITDPEGTQYFFGVDKLPGWTSSAQDTNSTDYVPVRAATSDQPCSELLTPTTVDFCQQAYAWNLSYVVDVHGNSQAYYYTQDTNYYRTKAGTGPTYSYVRASRLARVDYGMRAGSELTSKAPMVVHLGYTGRCEQGVTCAPGAAGNDVPYEQFNCPTASGCTVQAPTFYTHYRLWNVLSQTLVGTSYGNADYWSLVHTMPNPGDGTRPALWLHSITHSGADTTTTGITSWVTDPPTTFDGHGKYNRVQDIRSGQSSMNRIRLDYIGNSTGGHTDVAYMEAECTKEDITGGSADGKVDIVPETNTKRCFPQWWVPTDPIVEDSRLSYFNIYPVQKVTTYSSAGNDGSTPMQTTYDYIGTPLWKYAGPVIETSTGGSKKTWSVLGGWSQVKVTTGNDPVTANNPYTITTYFRGGHGTPANTSGGMRSISVTTSDGVTASVPDWPWFGGRVLEKRSYKGSGGAYLTGTITKPWASTNPTATSTAALGSVKAYFTGTEFTQTQIASSQGNGWRKTKTTNTYDTLGRIVAVSYDGEVPADDSCTTASYADNAGLNILSLPAVTSTYSAVCNTPGVTLLKSTRTLYDGSTSAVPGTTGYVTPTKADKTRVDAATAVSGGTATAWQAGPTTVYDALGRPTQSTDNSTGTARTTSTTYAPAAGAVTTVTSKNAAQWPTVTTLDSIRGNTLKTVDPNGHETSAKYDPSGREIASWDIRRPQANYSIPTVATTYNVSATSPPWVKKTTLSGNQDPTESYVIYDGMGRVRQTQAQSPGKGTIVTDTTYNSAGQKDLERNAYYVQSEPDGVLVTPTIAVPSSTLYEYEAGGRVSAVRAMAWDNDEISKTQYTYTGADTTTITITDDTGFTKPPIKTVNNAKGKLQNRTSYYGTTATGSADVSSYVYDVFGQLTGMGDGSNLWSWAYDPAGRQISSEDPDTGTSTTTYDAAGRVASRSDELNTVTKYSYDVLDRVTKQTVTAAGGTEKTLITNTYDGSSTKGVLSSSTRNNGAAFNQPVTTTFTGFDLAYTPGTTTTTLPAGLTNFSGSYTFTNTTTFTGKTDVAGTPAIAGLPAESVGYGYDGLDNPTEAVGSGNKYAGNGMYNHLGQLTKYTQADSNYSSGANTAGSVDVTFTWDATTGRLDKSQATNNLGVTSPDLGTTSYKYDPAGRITSRQQAYTSRPSSPLDNQCYSYDHADRIKAAWTPATTTCGTAPSSTATTVTGLGGPAPYAQTYTYTAAGDRSQVKRFGSNGALAVTETYAYPTPGTVGPHRVQSVTSSVIPTTPQSFTWDAVGRMTNRAGQAITYTLDGRVDTTTGTSAVPANPNPNATAGTPPAPTTAAGSAGARYYDAAGNLVGITDGTGTTITVGSITAHATSAGVKTATKTYTFAGKVVAQRTATSAGTKVAFIIGDSVNSAQTMALPNAAVGTGAVTLVRRTDPLGLARGANNTGTGTAAFTAATGTTAGTGSNAASATGFSAVNGYIAGLDDSVSSLTHLGARDMDPVLGVFTAPDPILNTEDQRGFTPYTYSFGNVINTSDPSGLRPTCDCQDDGGYTGPVPGSASQLEQGGRVVEPAQPIVRPAPAQSPGNSYMNMVNSAGPESGMFDTMYGTATARDGARLGMGPLESAAFGVSLPLALAACIPGYLACAGGGLAGTGLLAAGNAADNDGVLDEDAQAQAALGAGISFIPGGGTAKGALKPVLKGMEGAASHEVVQVWRVVGPEELADITASGGYRLGPGNEGKYFFPSREQAENLGQMYTKQGIGGPYTLTSGTAPSSVLRNVENLHAAGEGPAWFFREDSLKSICNVASYC